MIKPTPTAIKKLAGNPGKRPMNKHEIKPATGAPTCPAWLTDDALDEWNRVVPELDRLGVLTCVDGGVLEAYCVTYGEIVSTVKAGESLKAAFLVGPVAHLCRRIGFAPGGTRQAGHPEGKRR